MPKAKKIHITGLVQGVGFRPFIYRIATKNKLMGWVENSNEGVKIHVEGNQQNLDKFTSLIRDEAPQASHISHLYIEDAEIIAYDSFFIKKSENTSDKITDISPDIGVCPACLNDMKSQEHRLDYPFINCTNCGPRFTIIRDLPYDRPVTTMAPFAMCNTCREEYADINDRRFHAQPIACNHCGPEYALHINNDIVSELDKILELLGSLLDGGSIVAMKGLGGFHLACDAKNEQAVNSLREAKNRDGKPFAVMFRNINTARANTHLSDEEEKALTSWRRPIVLLRNAGDLAHGVSVGFNTIGAMLPYLPFHYLLFERLKTNVIVLTSGNLSDEPIIIDNAEALKRLGPISAAVLVNNRDIYNRTDDSVLRVINEKARLIRRSRSWVPRPIHLDLDVDGIFACGAELVNCFCIGKGNQAIMSQHIGDLKNAETLEFFLESATRFKKLFRFEPELVVHDLHPDYLSTRYAKELGIKAVAVQHHHAHIASCMAEYGLNEKVIGISFDGVGLGSDNHIWGGEFLICDLINFERFTHFDYVQMPGGDVATKEPWRMALSYLYKTFGEDFTKFGLPFLNEIPEEKVEIIIKALQLNINSPLTSSAGRLFDAVAALSGLCNMASFHAEAPMRLESIIDKNVSESYDFTIAKTIDTGGIIKGVCADIKQNTTVSTIAAKFHNSLINIIFAVVEMMSSKSDIKKVVLSGGSFQNEYILRNTEELLIEKGYQVFSPMEIPANDGGIALGQLAVAAARRTVEHGIKNKE